MSSYLRWQRYSKTLIVIAGIVLIVLTVMARAARLADDDPSAFVSLEFVALMAAVLILTGFSVWYSVSGRLFKRLKSLPTATRWPILLVGLAFGFLIVGFAPAFIGFIRPYILPFMLWLVIGGVGLIAMGVAAGQDAKSPALTANTPLRNVLFIALSILLPLLALEIGLRVWFTYFGSDYERAIYTYSADELTSDGAFTGMPYINFGLSPNYPGHNSLGFRGAEITREKPDGVFRIVALGGSTTYGADLKWQEVYPAQLEKILHEQYGYTNVQVINGGVVAYASWDTLANFEFHVLDIDPDMVIVYHAINDVLARLVDPAHYNSLNPARGIWSDDLPGLSPSVLQRFIGFNLGGLPNPGQLNTRMAISSDIQRCTARDYCENLGMTPQEILDANPPIYFERNLRSLILIAQGNDVQVMFSSWAYFPDPIADWIDPFITYPYVQEAVAEHNAFSASLAEQYALPYYDLMGNMPYDVNYWKDGLHMTPSGMTEQASEYAAYLVENGLIPPPDGD